MLNKLKRIFNFVYYSSVIFLVCFALVGAAYTLDYTPARIQTIVKNIPVPAPTKDTITQIREASSVYGVPWQLAVAVHLHESNDGKWLYRFEEKKMPVARKYASFIEEQRMLASSHGPMHVLGLTALTEYKLHWSKLYGPDGIDAGVHYLAKCWKNNAHIKSKEQRVIQTFLDYNGGGDPSYPGKVMAKLAIVILDQINIG